MGRLKLVWHKLSIHFRLYAKSDGMEKACLAQTLHPLPALCQIRWYGKSLFDSNSPSIKILSLYGWRVQPEVLRYPPSFLSHVRIRWIQRAKTQERTPSFFKLKHIRWTPCAKTPKCAPSFSSHRHIRWTPCAKTPKMPASPYKIPAGLMLSLTDPASESRRPASGALLAAVGRHRSFLGPLPLPHKK